LELLLRAILQHKELRAENKCTNAQRLGRICPQWDVLYLDRKEGEKYERLSNSVGLLLGAFARAGEVQVFSDLLC
jgi:hypothetical protein